MVLIRPNPWANFKKIGFGYYKGQPGSDIKTRFSAFLVDSFFSFSKTLLPRGGPKTERENGGREERVFGPRG